MSHKYYNRLASWVVEEEVKCVTKMVESLTQEFKDLRNAAGFIADIVDLEYEYAKSFGIDKDWPYTAQELNSHMLGCSQIIRDFSDGPKAVVRGANRPGHRDLYQRALKARRTSLDEFKYSSNLGLSNFGILVVIVGMLPRLTELRNYVFGITTLEEFKTLAIANLDGEKIHRSELNWRFKDLTNRQHRGNDIRNAFEAAWSVGQRDLAIKLLKG